MALSIQNSISNTNDYDVQNELSQIIMKSQQSQQVQDSAIEMKLLNIVSSERFYTLVVNLIETVFTEHVKNKVKKFCENTVKLELAKLGVGVSTCSQEAQSQNKVQKSNSHNAHCCKMCGKSGNHFETKGTTDVNKEKERKKEKEMPKNVKERQKANKQKVERPLAVAKQAQKAKIVNKIKSPQKILCAPLQPQSPRKHYHHHYHRKSEPNLQQQQKIKKSTSQKSTKGLIPDSSSPRSKEGSNKIENDPIAANEKELTEQKLKKVHKYLNIEFEDGFRTEPNDRIKQIVECNIHMKSKQIANLITKMREVEDLSRVTKFQTNSPNTSNISPFHRPSQSLSRVHNSYHYHNYLDREQQRDHGQSEFITRREDSYFRTSEPIKGKSFVSSGQKKSDRDKGKLLLRMVQAFGEEKRAEISGFIEKHENLAQHQIIEKWKKRKE